MKIGGKEVVTHLVRMSAIILLILACMFLPFLPGEYDGLAVTLSMMSQLFGVIGLLLVPIGAVWLIYETKKRATTNGKLSKDRTRHFAIASVVAASFVALVVSLGAFVNHKLSFGFCALALWAYLVSRLLSRLKLLKNAESRNFNATPLYLICIPLAAAIFTFTLVERATEFSRNYAIAKSAPLINDIEQYRNANGHYPKSLAALWPNYKPSVIGIKQYHYEPHGEAYNMFFEQFTFRFGAQEIVMYNKLDEHFFASHAMDILLWTPEQLRARRGYYAVHDAAIPHWKYFWFD